MEQLEYLTTSLTYSAWLILIALMAGAIECGLRALKRRARISKELHLLLRVSFFALVVLDCGIVLQFAARHFEPLARLLA